MAAATYTAEEVAAIAGVSSFAVYEAVKRQEAPIGTLAIRIGHRLVWPRRGIARLFQLDTDEMTS
jgi:predicted DNA-binding transcriptional regulator AlpA